MPLLVKLLLNSLYGENIRKDIEKNFACKSEAWLISEYDERVKDNWKISGLNYIVKLIDDARLKDEVEKLNTMPLHLGAFVLSNSNRNMNMLSMDFIQLLFIILIPIPYTLKINIVII